MLLLITDVEIELGHVLDIKEEGSDEGNVGKRSTLHNVVSFLIKLVRVIK